MGNGHWACGTAFAWKMRKFHWIRYQFWDFSHLGTRAHGRVRYRYIHTKCQIPHIFPDESVAGRTIRPCLTFVDLAEFAFKVLQCGLPRAGASWRRDQRNGKTTKTNKDTTTEATAVTARYGKKVRIERIAESLFAAHLVCEMQIKNTQIATQRPAIKRRYELIQLIATAWNCWPQHIPCVACVRVSADHDDHHLGSEQRKYCVRCDIQMAKRKQKTQSRKPGLGCRSKLVGYERALNA